MTYGSVAVSAVTATSTSSAAHSRNVVDDAFLDGTNDGANCEPGE
ncbi:hypothetical protein AB0H77_31160 [Streptomyces sp. NPDC050844]